MKRAQILKSSKGDNHAKLYISNIEVLTQSETNILENIQYRKRIEHAAKDLHIDWAVETSGNISQIVISKSMDTPATDQDFHELEMKSVSFMKVVHDIIEEEKKKPKTDDKEETSDLKFCKKLLKDFEPNDEGLYVCGAVIAEKINDVPGVFLSGQISGHLLKELLELYIKTNSHE